MRLLRLDQISNGIVCFNSRTPCGVRLPTPDLSLINCKVSIHAPRAGCDSPWIGRWAGCDVSIHAPRAGCDRSTLYRLTSAKGFNSRTPCGVRRCVSSASLIIFAFQFTHPVRGATYVCMTEWMGGEFQFTHPVRGATQFNETMKQRISVSIHAPRAGCDQTL